MTITAWKQDTAGASINVATSLALHDVAVAWAVSDSGVTSMTALTGFSAWTTVQNTKDGQTIAIAIKTDCDGTEGTVAIAANNNIIGGILGISGMDNTTQPDVAAGTGNDNLGSASPWSQAASSITPATNGALIVALFGSDITAGSATPPTVVFTNSGTGLTWTNQAVSNDGGFRQATIGTATQATAAAITVTGTGTLGGATAGPSIIVVALRPSAGGPNITSVSTATPREGASLTITGTAFGASQGSGDVKINGITQTVTAWSDTSITVTIVLGTNKFGAAYTVVVRDNALTASNSYAGITGLLPANSGLSYVDIGTPNTTSAYRLTASADLATGDQVEYQNMGGAVTVDTDATFSAGPGVSSFSFRVWTTGDGYGASATQLTTLGGGMTDRWQIRPFNKRVSIGF